MTTQAPLDISLDLETMGKGPRAAIVSIGAVAFPRIGELPPLGLDASPDFPFFYVTVSLDSCVKAGLEIDASTVEWWLRQSMDARREITRGGYALPDALDAFVRFYNHVMALSPATPHVWSNGKRFDCVILEQAYECCGRIAPFTYRDCRDFRTIIDLFPVERVKPIVPHHALYDAYAQAEMIVETLRQLSTLSR